MRALLWLCLGSLHAGCAGFREYDPDADEKAAARARERKEGDDAFWGDARAREALHAWLTESVAPVCDGAAGQPSKPSVQDAEQKGVRTQQRCGLLAYAADDLVGMCAPADDSCAAAIGERFTARARERYTRADMNWVANHCVGYPADCATLRDFELVAWRSHEEALWLVFQARMKTLRELRADEAAALEQQREARTSAALGAVAAGLQGAGAALQGAAGTACVSTRVGNTVTTSCR